MYLVDFECSNSFLTVYAWSNFLTSALQINIHFIPGLSDWLALSKTMAEHINNQS